MVLGIFSTQSVVLDKDNKTALDNYKYQGGDNGISYRYLHSPLAEFLASKLPKTIAPNSITLAGAMCLVLPHLIWIAIYGRAYEGPWSSWVAVAVGFSHIIYITLDNMDGKQARRTGTSSPLGQMFDHGCDAITFSIAIMTLCKFREITPGYLALAFVSLSPTGYFMYNIKEYYMGEYYLPVFNPVSEGSLIEFFFNMLCAYLGWEVMSRPLFLGLNFGECYAAFFVIFQIYQNIEMLIEILTAKKYEIPLEKSKFFIQFSSFFIVLIIWFVIAMISPNDMVHDSVDSGRCIGYIVMFTSSYLVLHLIIGHLARKEFNPYSYGPFRVTLIMLVGFLVLWKTYPKTAMQLEIYILYGIAGYLLINSLLVFASIVAQMEDHLKIKAFSINRKEKSN